MCFARWKRNSKQSQDVNIEKGKELFYKYYGSKFGIAHDLGSEYERCNIPKNLEEEWLKDIKNTLIAKIQSKDCVGHELCVFINRYEQICSSKELEDFIGIIEYCLNRELDTFTKLLICENLKNVSRRITDDQVLVRINEIIAKQKTELLSKEITVDGSHVEFARALYGRTTEDGSDKERTNVDYLVDEAITARLKKL